MNANTIGTLYVKANRIIERIDLCAGKHWARYNGNIDEKAYKELIKLMHIIVTTELNEKGVERKWRK